MSTAGYSGTPLAKKLGIKDGAKVVAVGVPKGYRQLLEPLPPAVRFSSKVDDATDLVRHLASPSAVPRNDVSMPCMAFSAIRSRWKSSIHLTCGSRFWAKS